MFIPRIKQIRKSKNISQFELASRVGLNQAEVSRKEKGISGMTVDQLFLFAKALEVSPVDLLFDTVVQEVG